MTEIVLMSDPKVAAVPVQECAELLVDVRRDIPLLVDLAGRRAEVAGLRWRLSGEVVADHVDRQAGLGLAVDLVEGVPEVHGPVLRGQLRDHLARRGVQGGEQIDRTGQSWARCVYQAFQSPP
jgi:hypothetical protein